MSPIAQDALQETYRDEEDRLAKLVRAFKRRFPRADVDELSSIASEAFLEAYRSHDAEKGKFSTWLQMIVWKRMLDRVKKYARKHDGISIEPLPENLQSTDTNPLHDMSTDLSVDACQVLKLIFVMNDVSGMKHRTPQKPLLRRVLKDMGWTADRITTAFQELAEAVQ